MTKERDDDRAPRRRLLKKLAAGGSVASLAAMPGKWAKPVVASVILPAHAQTSPQGCTGTLDNCPSGFLVTDGGPITNNKYFDPSLVTSTFPGITYSGGSFTGSDTFQKYERNGPCPSPCDNADESKYVTASLAFSDNTVSMGGSMELRCGGDAVQDLSFQFTGTYFTVSGDSRVYSGNGSYTVEACKYLSGPSRARSGGSGAQILRSFQFGR